MDIIIRISFIFFIAPLLLAIKYPVVRIAMGIVQIIVGLIFITTLWWLFGIGLFIGAPTLIVGIIFLLTGFYSKQKQMRSSDYEQALLRRVNKESSDGEIEKSAPQIDATDQLKIL